MKKFFSFFFILTFGTLVLIFVDGDLAWQSATEYRNEN